MDEAEATLRYERLLATLDELIMLLEEASETHWTEFMSRCRRRIAGGDALGLKTLVSAFRGGMGTFLDLFLTPANGHTVAPSEVSRVNDELSQLGAAALGDAQALWEDLRR